MRTDDDLLLVGEAATAAEGIQEYRRVGPDVTLLGLRLPDMSGLDALVTLCGDFPDARVLVLADSYTPTGVKHALMAGARGFLLKSAPPHELVAAVRDIHAGMKWIPPAMAGCLADCVMEDALTAREAEILQLLAAGHRNRDVAKALSISEETVKVHVKHVMEKLDAADRTQAVIIGVRRGIVRI